MKTDGGGGHGISRAALGGTKQSGEGGRRRRIKTPRRLHEELKEKRERKWRRNLKHLSTITDAPQQ